MVPEDGTVFIKKALISAGAKLVPTVFFVIMYYLITIC
jgi:hypothetical protein